MKVLFILLLLTCSLARKYPLFKQCNPKWRLDKVGSSSKTICGIGCAISSLAMGLAGIGKNYDPGTLNAWLKGHSGYSGALIIWGSVSKLGLKFIGKVANSKIKSHLDAGRVVICNVHNGGHWVLATGIIGNTVYVNDPGYNIASYTLSQIVDGQNVIYSVG